MRILSHRGYWLTSNEKNSELAFRRSFLSGYGTETDLRDCSGELVIAHDPPRGAELSFRHFLDIYAETGRGLPLALNVKADGLQAQVAPVLAEFEVENYFFFDMSTPDAMAYIKQTLPVFTRHSDIEPTPVLYEQAVGVWVDGFFGDWMSDGVLPAHLSAGKQVCIVSPELHGRAHLPLWEWLRAQPCRQDPAVMICTDFPQDAMRYFDD